MPNVNIRTQLEHLLNERILVLDGAMGTMIQRHKLTEEDFRGERFKSHSKELRGNNDLLVLTRPDIILDIHKQYLEAARSLDERGPLLNPGLERAGRPLATDARPHPHQYCGQAAGFERVSSGFRKVRTLSRSEVSS